MSMKSGWVQFAAIVMFAVGFLRIITAISYFAKSNKINNLTLGLFGGQVWVWGLWDLVIAALALFAGYSLLGNGEFGRIVAYIWGILVIVNSFLILGWAPWYGIGMLALSTCVVYGLAVTSGDGGGSTARA
jgi:hypothetical protein